MLLYKWGWSLFVFINDIMLNYMQVEEAVIKMEKSMQLLLEVNFSFLYYWILILYKGFVFFIFRNKNFN